MKDKELYFEDLKDKVDSVFALINLASKRVRELASGAPKLIQTECNDPMQIALEEIAQGKIVSGKRGDIAQEEISGDIGQAEGAIKGEKEDKEKVKGAEAEKKGKNRKKKKKKE
jgi:DNA-directed RNA polymerase omega subunit